MRKMTLMLAIGAVATLPAFAADETGQWYLMPQIGNVWTDHDRHASDNNFLYGLALGKHLTDAWSLEFNLNSVQVGTPAYGSLHFYGSSVDVLRVFNRAGAFSPFVSVGAGMLNADPKPGPSANDFMAEAGVGAMWDLWSNSAGSRTLSLRPELKARYDDAGAPGHLVDYLALVGLQFSFGPEHVSQTVLAPPVAAVVAPPPPPPAAPSDSDHDGVIDAQDQCPDTPAGVAVDPQGCPQRGSIVLEGVTFENNSAALTGPSRPDLDRVAEGLQQHPRLKIEIQGHTDSVGGDKYNLALSERRATSVADYLLSKGVARTQLVSKGYGEAEPVANNATADGRAKNRRVVMLVLENPGDVKVEGAGTADAGKP